MDILGTVDPANVHHVMSSNFPKGLEFLKMFGVLGDGIFNSDADLWKNQRKLARVLINHQRFYPFLVKTSRGKVETRLIPVLNHVSEQGLIVDLQDLFQRFTFDTSCILITSYDPGCLSIEFPDVPFAKAMDDAEEALLMRHVVLETVWRIQSWLGIGHEKKLSEAWKTLDRVINKCVSMKKEEMSKKAELKEREEEEEAVDLLTSYLIEDDTFNLKRNDKFLRDTILNLMLAGRDTTSSALTWFIWLVSQHPTVEEKIREELKLVILKEKLRNGCFSRQKS
ncbi:Alkane hydroxylase MAH1 [Camellia lanceoleosa]|nr:Alkane hydroxylase MAH1 [Camellia lanceoleosa]KAI7979932.1 Alkane hydroxylase MAH1 [Camellia lanceoleosa]